jgi:glycosyltransferase involved in cell wall biosynthesis
MNQRSFDVSVVIPTYKRPDLLHRCLRTVLRQTLERRRYEVIVVDDGQTDDTRALVETLARQTQGFPLVRYLRPEGTRGPAAARNRGWRAAEGEVVAFTDDDTLPDLDWLNQGLLAIGPDQAAVRGAVHVPIEGPMTDHGRMTKGLEAAEFVTANCFVRRSALQAVDGFDERFLRAWREDSDLHFKLLERYGEVPKAPQAVVLHPVREAPFGISLKQQANMMFDALLFKKHPDLYKRKVGRLRAPASYYAIVLGTLGVPVAALSGHPRVAGVLVLAVLALIAQLAARRLRDTARTPEHVAEMLVTSAAIPFLSLFWRIRGGLRFRVPFF